MKVSYVFFVLRKVKTQTYTKYFLYYISLKNSTEYLYIAKLAESAVLHLNEKLPDAMLKCRYNLLVCIYEKKPL